MTAKSPTRAMYLIPNSITLMAMASGLVAVTVAMQPGAHGKAAAFIMLAAVLDLLDGRVARMTNTQSEFGVQLDSLSDAIAFGVAPALLMYAFSLEAVGVMGLAACCVYTACAIVRLARFNVAAAEEHDGPGRFMTGLSVPVSAAILMSIVGIDATTTASFSGAGSGLAMSVAMVVLGLLMVSTVPFRSFKDLKMDASTIAIIVGFVVASGAAWWIWSPAIGLAGLLVIYLLQGFTELVRRNVQSAG